MNGTGRFVGNVDLEAGLDVTGDITVTDDIEMTDYDYIGLGSSVGRIHFDDVGAGTDQIEIHDANVVIGTNAPNSKLHVDASFACKYSEVTSSTYSTDGNDNCIIGVNYAGTVTIELDNDDLQAGRIIHIVDVRGNAGTYNVTIDPEGATQINGSNTRTLTTDYQPAIIFSDGSAWFLLSQI